LIVKDLKELRGLVSKQKKTNCKISTINGTFDLLHKGHIDALDFALSNSEKLYILVNSDRSVGLYKGPSRPIDSEQIRINKIEEKFPNAFIFVFDDLNPLNLIKEILPDVHFIGPDWGKKTLEQELVESSGGKIISLKKNFDISTTKILKQDNKSDIINKAIFLDRDGTMIVDKGYLNNIDEIEFFPNTIEALKNFLDLGFLLFIVSNQSMVGRGMATKEEALKINTEIVKQLKENNIEVKESFIDFSHPEESSITRKPNTQFLEIASTQYEIALKDCWVIGDKESDVIFGKKGNTKTIQINGVYKNSFFADYLVNDLLEAYEIISQY